jgi:plastocyanin
VRRTLVTTAAVLLVTTSCVSGGANERSVFVDFSHDEFSSFMIANFPSKVTLTPGDTVTFNQVWTGEPHTVTGGTLVDEMIGKTRFWFGFFDAFEALLGAGVELPDPEDPPDIPVSEFFDVVRKAKDKDLSRDFFESYEEVASNVKGLPVADDPGDMRFPELVEIIDKRSNEALEDESLPWALDDNDEGSFVTQNAGQPCFLDKGAPPKSSKRPCNASQQEQPVFDGKASYYNSGVIPYEGPQGNTFKVELSDDIDPGSYFFYCAVHGPDQNTEIVVKPTGSKIPSEEAVNRQARREIASFAKPMLDVFRDARDGEIDMNGEKVEGPFAGLSSEAHGSINEFVPDTIETEVGDPVTWKVMGSDHSISFDVPEYFPIIRFAENGEVSLNPRIQPPSGGSPDIPEREGEGEGILEVDGGTYDGDGFFSSGLFGGEPYATYTLRFSEPGTYKYACLLHPPMVGTVEVT